jgi:hypothetical protein
VNRVDLLHLQEVLEPGEPAFHLEQVADFVQFRLVPLADGIALRVGVLLVQGDELGAEPEADNCDLDFFSGGHVCPPTVSEDG